jgi:hypothetical protein
VASEAKLAAGVIPATSKEAVASRKMSGGSRQTLIRIYSRYRSDYLGREMTIQRQVLRTIVRFLSALERNFEIFSTGFSMAIALNI